MIQYLTRHWQGAHHILLALLVNGILVYTLAIAAILLVANQLQWPVLSTPQLVASLLPLLVIFGWSGVGVMRSALRTISDQHAHPVWKIFSVVAALLVLVAIVATASDLRRLSSST